MGAGRLGAVGRRDPLDRHSDQIIATPADDPYVQPITGTVRGTNNLAAPSFAMPSPRAPMLSMTTSWCSPLCAAIAVAPTPA
jgi:hypothetical protein